MLTEWDIIIIIVITHLRTFGSLLNSGRLGETHEGMFRKQSSRTPENKPTITRRENEIDTHTDVCVHTDVHAT
jgi:hypothetical protein